MRRLLFSLFLVPGLAACGDNFTPNPKVAAYDPASRTVVPPHPCPDWSQTQTMNYLNENHSNFGCAVNTNNAVQLADPKDLVQGHGTHGPDTGVSTHVIELYRAGAIPQTLTPMQSSVTSGGGASGATQ